MPGVTVLARRELGVPVDLVHSLTIITMSWKPGQGCGSGETLPGSVPSFEKKTPDQDERIAGPGSEPRKQPYPDHTYFCTYIIQLILFSYNLKVNLIDILLLYYNFGQ